MRTQLEAALPDAQVMDYREGNPALTRGLDNATSILSLICLVAMVLGAIGVAMAMHAHLEQRMDMLAILKAVGADSSDLLRIFLLQTLALGMAGACWAWPLAWASWWRCRRRSAISSPFISRFDFHGSRR